MKQLLLIIYTTSIFFSFNSLAQIPKLVIPVGHTKTIRTITISPNDKILATGGNDALIKIWNANTGQELKTLQGHKGYIYSLEFTPDNKFLISGGMDKTIKIWDLENGKLLRTLVHVPKRKRANFFDILLPRKNRPDRPNYPKTVKTIKLTVDGKRIVAGAGDSLKIFDLDSGTQLPSFASPDREMDFRFISKDLSLAVSKKKDIIQVWDIEQKKPIRSVSSVKEIIFEITISPDNKRVYYTQKKDILYFNLMNENKPEIIKGHKNRIIKIKFSPDGQSFVSGGLDNKMFIWNSSKHKQDGTLNEGIGVMDFVFNKNGSNLFSARLDQSISKWDLYEKEKQLEFGGKTISVDKIEMAPDESKIAIISDKEILIWDLENGQLKKILSSNKRKVEHLRFSPDSKKIITTDSDFLIKLWDLEQETLEKTFKGHKNYISDVVFSSDGTQLLSGSWDGTAKIWDVNSGNKIKSLDINRKSVSKTLFSIDEKTIIVTAGRRLYHIDLESGEELNNAYSSDGNFTHIIFSPDHNYIFTGSSTGRFDRLSFPELEHITKYKIHRDDVTGIKISNDSKFVYSVSKDNVFSQAEIERRSSSIKVKEMVNLESLCMYKEGKYLIASNQIYGIQIYESQTLKKVANLSIFPGQDWLISTPNGKFTGTKNAINNIYFVNGLTVNNEFEYKRKMQNDNLWEEIFN